MYSKCLHIHYNYIAYIQELNVVESEHCVKEVISEDSKVNRNKFMQILW